MVCTQVSWVQTIILAGADYLDSVYILADSESTAAPYFDANPAITNQCSTNGSTNGQGCKWDLTKSATVSKLSVNPQTGVIDLQKSLSQGAFGLVPLDGATITPDIYYTLRDKSNQAVQHIQVQFIYYSSAALIPTALTNEIAGRRLNALLNKLINLNPSPRPPIVIVSRFH